MAFANDENMASGGNDHTVRLWKLVHSYGVPLCITVSHVMRSHKEPVTCLAASRTWSIVTSRSKDGNAIVWYLNRGIYVVSIWHGDDERHEVHLVAINESMVCFFFHFLSRLTLTDDM
jgi:WD40 repeat protein